MKPMMVRKLRFPTYYDLIKGDHDGRKEKEGLGIR